MIYTGNEAMMAVRLYYIHQTPNTHVRTTMQKQAYVIL